MEKKIIEPTPEKEETAQERKTRRTTLQDSLLKPFDKNSPLLPKSIDIRLLEGNIFLGQKPDLIDPKEINDPGKMIDLIRNGANRVNFYCELFNTKARLLIDIMSDLFEKFKMHIGAFLEGYSVLEGYISGVEGAYPEGEGEAVSEKLEELRGLYKQFRVDVKGLEEKIGYEYKRLVSDNKFKGTLDKILIAKRNFSSCFSVTIRFIQDKEDVYSNFDPKRNLFILENKICSFMKIFRIFFNKKVIYHLFSISEELEKKAKKFNNRIVSILDYLQENYQIEEKKAYSFFENLQKCGKNNHINFYNIMSASHKKFIKKKLRIRESIRIRNEDFLDFFEFYDFKYSINSPFIVSYLKCEMKGAKASETISGYLCLDVSITTTRDYPTLAYPTQRHPLFTFLGLCQFEPSHQKNGLFRPPERSIHGGTLCPEQQSDFENGS